MISGFSFFFLDRILFMAAAAVEEPLVVIPKEVRHFPSVRREDYRMDFF